MKKEMPETPYSFSEIRIFFHQDKIVAFLIDREGDDLLYQGHSFLLLEEKITKQIKSMKASGWRCRKKDDDQDIAKRVREYFRSLL